MEWKKIWFAPALGLAMFVYLVIPAWAQVEVGDGLWVSGSAEVGGLPMSLSGSKARFNEYRDVPETVVVPELELKLERKKEDYYLHFGATDVGQDDQNYQLRFGRYGLLDVQFEWDQIPHYFSNGRAATPYNGSNGTFTLSSKPTPTGPVEPADPVNIPSRFSVADVETWLNANARGIDIKTLQDLASFKVRYTPRPEWTFTGHFRYQNDDGERSRSALFGTSPGGHIIEFLEPVDYQTWNAGFGGDYAGNGWSVGLKYNGSFFHNGASTVVWDNHLNPGIGAACVDDVRYDQDGAGPCQGRLDLWPSNQAHTIALSGAATLPLKNYFMGTFSYGWRFQDDSFLPFTTNNVLLASLATPPTISHDDLDGDVRPMMVNVTLTNRYFNRLGLKAYYRFYDLDNKSNRVRFEHGYIIGDSGLRDLELLTFPYSYSKQNIGLGASYKVTRSLTAKFDYVLEKMHREAARSLLNSNEHTFGPTFDLMPTPWLLVRASYKRSLRDAHDYDIGRKIQIEFDETRDEIREEHLAALRKFSMAARNRDKVALFTQITPMDNLMFHAAFDFSHDRYTRSVIGLTKNVSYVPSVGFNYAPADWISFFGDYNYDRNKSRLKNINRSEQDAADLPPGCPADRDAQTPENCPTNVWNSRETDRVHTFGVGSDIALIKDLLDLRLEYTHSHGKHQTRSSGNKCRDLVASCSNAPAADFPKVSSRWQELSARLEYHLSKHVTLKAGYYFNRFDSDDFGLDVMRSFMAGERHVFLGDNIKEEYTSHVGVIGLRFKF